MPREPHPSGGHRELDLEPDAHEEGLELATPAPGADAAPTPAPAAPVTELPESGAAAPALGVQRFPARDARQVAQARAPLLRQVEQRRARLPAAPATSVRTDLGHARWIYLTLALLVLAGAAYAYARYRVHERQHQFFMANQELRTLVMQTRPRPGVEDVRRVVLQLAAQAGLELAPTDVEVIVEPLATSAHASALDPEELTRAQAFGASWIVGHRTRARSRFALLSERFQLERFFYLHDFDAPRRGAPAP